MTVRTLGKTLLHLLSIDDWLISSALLWTFEWQQFAVEDCEWATGAACSVVEHDCEWLMDARLSGLLMTSISLSILMKDEFFTPDLQLFVIADHNALWPPTCC